MIVCAICTHPAPVQCAACHRAAYCGEEHQKVAWKKHRKLCKIFQKIDRGEVVDPKSYCGLCGKTDGPMRTTDCCGKNICNEMDDFGFSYERGSCLFNHDRFTLCSNHHESRHSGDWKTCSKCAADFKEETYAGFGTNTFNFPDDILPNPPAFTPKNCSDCGRMIKKNSENHTILPSGGFQCHICNAF